MAFTVVPNISGAAVTSAEWSVTDEEGSPIEGITVTADSENNRWAAVAVADTVAAGTKAVLRVANVNGNPELAAEAAIEVVQRKVLKDDSRNGLDTPIPDTVRFAQAEDGTNNAIRGYFSIQDPEQIVNDAMTNGKSFTVSSRVYVPASVADSSTGTMENNEKHTMIAGIGDDSFAYRIYYNRNNGDVHVDAYVSSGSSWDQATSSTLDGSFFNAWHTLTVTYDTEDGLSIYIDGALNGQAEVKNVTSVHKNDETFSVGYEPQKTTRYSELRFDQVVVYSEALTADQLAESHSASDENVVLWLDFDANPEQEPEEPEEPVSKAILEYFLNAAKGLVEDGTVSGLVESVQKMFEEAIAQGETVVADENATRQEVLDAAKDLMLAIQAQDMRAADKTDLEMALELTEMIDLSKYVEAGQAEYLAAKEVAEAVLADGDAMQDETDTAWSTLIEAINALRLKAEKSVLQDLISRMEAVDLSAYTGESAAVFRAALASANTILADETLSVDAQDQVDGAVKTLQQAYDGLVKAQGGETENPGSSEKPQNPENPENSGTPENTQNPSYGQSGSVNQNQAGSRDGNTAASESKAVKTGDTAGNGLAAAGCISMLSLFGIALILRQRRRD